MVIGKLTITVNTEEDPYLVTVDSDTPNLAGFYSRRRSTALIDDGTLGEQMEDEVNAAFPENIPA